MKIRPVRGTHDLFGDDIIKYTEIERLVKEFAKLNSFRELRTPIFELTELFAKPLGEQSDVVLKEMYTFKDRNDELLTLRPEYTTPMIRAAITNNMLNDLPLKVYGLGPMFRRERPQKGRYRQFNQINFEIFGSNDFVADLEIIVLGYDILKSLLKKSSFKLNINSLGKKENLIEYKSKLTQYFQDNKNKLSNDSVSKIDSNPLRILDSKNEDDIDVCKLAPSINEFISAEEKKHFEEIKSGLDFYQIDYKINHNLVRGLDYYCSTVFEFKTDNLGSQDTLLGGGRYDGLIGALGGPEIPGVGWAAGIERVLMLMPSLNYEDDQVHIAITNDKFILHYHKLANFLKENKISFYWNYKYNLKKSLSKANSNNTRFIIIIGENEFKNDFYTLKNLITGNQYELNISQLKKYLNDKSW